MLSKLFLVFGILQWAYLFAADVDIDIETATCVKNEIKIQHSVLEKMSSYTRGLWNITAPNQNIQFSPLIDVINKNIALIEVYYENALAKLYPQNRFLEEPFELAKLLDRLQQSSSVNLRFKNALFADWRYINHDYLYDVTLYYHSEAYTASLVPNNTDSIQNLVHRWMTKNTRGRKPESENLLLPGLTHFHTNVLQYSACWNYPMISEEPQLFTFYPRETHQRRRRFISMSKLPTFNFDNLPKTYVDSLGQRQVLRHYNDTQRGYEAISIPYRGNEFAMAVLMPHVNRSVDMFVNFTADDYLQILERISQETNYDFIHYVIPALNISMVSITEAGTSINQKDRVDCGQSLLWNEKPQYKEFIVDRPYGLILYHEGTKYVLWQAWIRDPTSDVYVPRRILNHTNNPMSEGLDHRHIF